MSYTKFVSVMLMAVLTLTACGQPRAKRPLLNRTHGGPAMDPQLTPDSPVIDLDAKPTVPVVKEPMVPRERQDEPFTETNPSEPVTTANNDDTSKTSGDVVIDRVTTRTTSKSDDTIDKIDKVDKKDDKKAGEKANSCTTTFMKNDKDWNPGVPYALATEPHFTYGAEELTTHKSGKKKKQKHQIQYTDAAADGLMDVLFQKASRLPKAIQNSSKQLAIRIDDLKFHIDQRSGAVKMQFGYEAKRGTLMPFKLIGQLDTVRGSNRFVARLQQVVNTSKGQKPNFSAEVTCADSEMGCQNVMIRLQQLAQSGRTIRTAFIVHRWGPIHVTIAKQDRDEKTIDNAAHKEFVKFLIGTEQNSCLALVEDVSKAQRDIPACTLERKVHDCGGKTKVPNVANDFMMRTWAVAYGKAGFEWMATSKTVRSLIDYENQTDVSMSIGGGLAISNSRPMWPEALTVAKELQFSRQVADARLVATDGGGNLNLQLVFKGKPRSHTRITLTSLFEDNRTRGLIAKEMEQMPDIAAQDLSEKIEPADEIVVNGK